VRFQVGDVLHPALDSLRNEHGFLLGGGQLGESFANPLAVPVVAQDEPRAASTFGAINRHRGGAEFHRGKRARGFGALLAGRFAVCHQFVTTLVHGRWKGVNWSPIGLRNPLIIKG
jgi:hypothetical protein